MRYTKKQVRDIVVEQTKLADEQVAELGKKVDHEALKGTLISVMALLVGIAYGMWFMSLGAK